MNSIIYIADPMCSWCYGFSNEVTQLKEQYAADFSFQMVMGGLRPGGGDPWEDKFKNMLKHHWEKVAEASGLPFGYELFNRESFNYDTEPSCRAVCVVKDLAPEHAFGFFKTVQSRFYAESQDPSELEFYQPICENFGIPFDQFSMLFLSEQYKEKTRADFAQCMEWGIRGFPSVIIQMDEQLTLLTKGYMKFADMQKRLDTFLSRVASFKN